MKSNLEKVIDKIYDSFSQVGISAQGTANNTRADVIELFDYIGKETPKNKGLYVTISHNNRPDGRYISVYLLRTEHVYRKGTPQQKIAEVEAEHAGLDKLREEAYMELKHGMSALSKYTKSYKSFYAKYGHLIACVKTKELDSLEDMSEDADVASLLKMLKKYDIDVMNTK